MEVLHPLVPASSAGLIPGFSFLQLSQEEGSDSGIVEGDSKASALATSEPKCDACEGEGQFSVLSQHLQILCGTRSSKMLEEGVGRLQKNPWFGMESFEIFVLKIERMQMFTTGVVWLVKNKML